MCYRGTDECSKTIYIFQRSANLQVQIAFKLVGAGRSGSLNDRLLRSSSAVNLVFKVLIASQKVPVLVQPFGIVRARGGYPGAEERPHAISRRKNCRQFPE